MPINETIYEDGNGGQLYNQNNDIVRTESLFTLAYLQLFSGNKEESTVKNRNVGGFNGDWWANDKSESSDKWINSETERTLRGIELSGSSIAKIKQSVVKDTKELEQYGEVEVSVTLPRINAVKIEIKIKEPSKKDSNTLIFIWDATKKEVIEQLTLK